MLHYRRIALWIAVLIVPGGLFLLPLLLADMRRQKAAAKAATQVPKDEPKQPNDGPGPSPATPGNGTPPRLAA